MQTIKNDGNAGNYGNDENIYNKNQSESEHIIILPY